MPRQLILECVIDLPDGVIEQAEAILRVKDPLRAFMLEAEALGGRVKLDEVETRAKPPQGKKMGRPRRGPMRIIEPPEPDAAA